MASKIAKSNLWGVLDSDDEDAVCCSSSSCRHSSSSSSSRTFGGMNLFWLEEQITRKRFWPYPSAAEEDSPSAWPCRSCPPWMCDEGEFWECDHGKWVWVESWGSVPPLPWDHTLKECRGGSCSGHGMISADLLPLFLAQEAGLMWGDIMMMEEEAVRAAETPKERAARLAAEARKEAESQRAMAEAEIRKAKELVALRAAPPNRRYDRRTGKPMPCKFFCFQGVLGREHPAERDPKTGTMWDSGCAYHKKGKCEFFHPDEPEWQVILGKVASVPTSSRPTTPELEWRSVGANTSSSSSGRPPLHPSGGRGGGGARGAGAGGGRR
jgi:hypothetical protein